MAKHPAKPADVTANPRHKQKQAPNPTHPHRGIRDRLTSLTKKEAGPNDFEQFFEQTRGEKNDRGAAILLATNVEIGLDSALKRIISRGRSNMLFGVDKPLGSFRNKIWLAYGFGLIGDETYGNLELIRDIRNTFAHSQIPITFDTPEVVEACNALTFPQMRPPVSILATMHDGEKQKAQGRARYENACDRIGHNLNVLNWRGVLFLDSGACGKQIPEGYTWVQARQAPLP